MDLVSSILSALLFAAFVPGVLLSLPKGGSKATVLVVHALLFAVVTQVVMWFYWTRIRERFGNYGPTCPNGYVPGKNQAGQPDCIPTGHPTFNASAKLL
jgi:Na+/melibiose symporter-like transporter